MDNPTTSFIPKMAPPTRAPAYRGGGFGFVLTVSIVMLVVSVGVLAGAYFYKGAAQQEIDNLSADLDKIQREFDLTSIGEFARVANTIEMAKSALAAHVAFSNVFKLLEDNTLQDVRFASFNAGASDRTSFILNGEAASFTDLATQAFVLEQNPMVKSISLSNLMLRKGGVVGFDLNLIVDSALFAYKSQ